MTQQDRLSPEPTFVFSEDGGRPWIGAPQNEYRFRPTDRVYIRETATRPREGPFMIEAAAHGKYTLCDLKGAQVKQGQEFAETELEEEDPFA